MCEWCRWGCVCRCVRPRGAGVAAWRGGGAVRRGAARSRLPPALLLAGARRVALHQPRGVLQRRDRLLGLRRRHLVLRPLLHDLLSRRHAGLRRHRDQELGKLLFVLHINS